MKNNRRFLVLLIALLMAFVLAAPAFAADYTYTVTFYAGVQGTINGSDKYVINGLNYGDRVSFDMASVKVNADSKYYVKGIRESARDNSELSDLSSFEVTKDMDFVVAYGMLGNAVGYTVKYQDADGNKLLDDNTFNGNVGDKPVIAFKYIEDYQPQYYNLTGTLKENAADNLFIFVYYPVEKEEEAEGGESGSTETESSETESTNPSTGTTSAKKKTDGTAAVEAPEPQEIGDLDVLLKNETEEVEKPATTEPEQQPEQTVAEKTRQNVQRSILPIMIATCVVSLGLIGLLIGVIVNIRKRPQ